ncbi:MAG: alpha/beta fold hydrolase, partial [Chloroflexota bacterium]
IALHYALKYPGKVEKIAFINSLGLSSRVSWWVRLLTTSVFIKSFGRAALSVIRAIVWIAESLYPGRQFADPLPPAKFSMGEYVSSLKNQPVVPHWLASLKVPTLLLWGARDRIVPVGNAYAAARVIPDCRLQVFEDCGHSFRKENINEFAQVLLHFLRQPTVPTRTPVIPEVRPVKQSAQLVGAPVLAALMAFLLTLVKTR